MKTVGYEELTDEERDLFDRWDDGECVCGHDIMEHLEEDIWPCTVEGCKCKDFKPIPCPVSFTRTP
jgi:hypothetical protein